MGEPVPNSTSTADPSNRAGENFRFPLPSWAPWFVIALALVARLAWLGMKPPHFDEGVNGWFIDQMTRQGFYHYDPGNYHGPFHFYVLFLAQTLFGRDVVALRLPLVLVNVATVWLILQFRRFLPERACLVAALGFAVSTGMLFYSRYAIHEAWLVFGMVLGFWGAAELWSRGSALGLWAAAMGVTLMVLTKETYIIHLVAFGLAVGTLRLLECRVPSEGGLPPRAVAQQWSWGTLGNVLAVALLLILFFYSGGFLDPSSLKGLFETFAAWFRTGVHEEAHQKEWYYWLELMGRYEWTAVLGFLYGARALLPGMNRLSRLLAIYGCGVLVAYSIVPYKTPWCIISIIWPFFFLFGDAMDRLARLSPGKRWPAWTAGIVTAAALAASLGNAVWLNYFHPTDARQKYVYVQTLDDLFKLTDPLKKLLANDPRAYHMPAHILLSSYHPLPWVLGDFTAVGYYEKEDAQPPSMDAGFLIVEPERIAEVEDQLQGRYFVESFQLRDGMDSGRLYLSESRFAPVFPGRVPEFVPGAAIPSHAPLTPPPSVEPRPPQTEGEPTFAQEPDTR